MKTLLLLLQHLLQHEISPTSMFFLSTTILIISLYFFFFILNQKKSNPKLPPSPPRLPLLGNLHQLGSLPHRSLKSLSDKYGPLMLLHFGCVPTIIVSSAEMAREMLKTHDLIFASRPAVSTAKKLLYDCNDVAFSPYGEHWRQVRRICVLHLLSVKRVQSFSSVREEEVSLMVEKIRKSCPGSVNLSKMILTFTADTISRVTLGRKYRDEEGGGSRGNELVMELTALLGTFPVKDFIPRLAWLDKVSGLDARLTKTHNEFDSFLERVLEEHLHAKTCGTSSKHESRDFIDILLSLDHEDGPSLHRDNIKAMILDMFAAGIDTTFTTMEWALAELIKDPNVMKRVQNEVREVIGSKEKIMEEDLEKMIFMKAVIKETLRLHPPAPLLVPREIIEDVKFQGYEISSGTRVMINAWAIGRDSKSWDKPEDFYPDRFMNCNVDYKGQDFQLIPFGSGRRGCPGIGFGIAIVEIVLANILNHFDWELSDEMKGKVFDMTEAIGITVHRKSNLVLIARNKF